MTHPELNLLTYCLPRHFHSYGKAAFCLEELMMTNPHNHLYCEQYAEVSSSSTLRAGCGVNAEIPLLIRRERLLLFF